jgi:hypothetical protein
MNRAYIFHNQSERSVPLLDHFHPPLSLERSWEAFHSAWATSLVDALTPMLPEGYFAEENTHAGARVEIDVAAFEKDAVTRNGGTAVAVAPRVWSPPEPELVLPAVFPEGFEVLVFSTRSGPKLVAAIDLVSPANKDRSNTRRAFASKCANYLYQGISLIILDIVTERQANLHNETMTVMNAPASFHMPSEVSLYATAYRPVRREQIEQIELWRKELRLGEPLPVLPLAINVEHVLRVDFESTYDHLCRRRNLI